MRTIGSITLGISMLLLTGASASAQQSDIANNVVVVLDASGSMSERLPDGKVRMDAAKDALKRVLAKLPEGTNVGITVFSSSVREPDGWVYPLGKMDRQKLNRAIDGISEDGGTPLGRYIEIGANRLLAQRDKQFNVGSFKLIVITDGEASDSELMSQMAPEAVQRGLQVDVIGVGMESQHALAKMANTYQSASDERSLERAVQQVVVTEIVPGTGNGENAYAIVSAAFSEASAKSALSALGNYQNHPLGTAPPAPPQEQAVSANGSQGPGASADASGPAGSGCGCHAVGNPHVHMEPLTLAIGILMVLGLAVWRRNRRRLQEIAVRRRRS